MPKLCVNLGWLFCEVPFLDRFAAAARAGFKGVEYASPYEYDARELRARLDDNGLEQVLINTIPGDRSKGDRGLGCLPGREDEFRASVDQALDHAGTLGCKRIHVLAGVPPEGVSRETALAIYANNFAWAGDKAVKQGVRLLIEPLNPKDAPGYLISTQEQGAAIVEAIGVDRTGLQFDTYHCQLAQGNLANRLTALMPVIGHMQLGDVPGRHEPGTGEIGWDYLFRHIDALGYDGWIGCEYQPAAGTEAGLGWRERYGV
jgi:hydroxypyruvate isomerase